MKVKFAALSIFCALSLIDAASPPRTGQQSPSTLRAPAGETRGKNDLTGQMKEIWLNADGFELLEIEPPLVLRRKGLDSGGRTDLLQGRRVLRKIPIRSDNVRRRLLDAWAAGLINMDEMNMCHDSRHGIRATRGEEAVEIIIDFRCNQFYAFHAGERVRGWLKDDTRSAFNRILRRAGIKYKIV
jgi:hypothetical protein